MDIGSFLLMLALTIPVALYIARPFFEHKSRSVTREEHDLSALLAERDRTLNSIQELDFDYALHKVPEEVYTVQRTFLVQKGTEILRRIDEYQPEKATVQAEDRLEAAIAARRGVAVPQPQAVAVGAASNGAIAGGTVMAVAESAQAMDDPVEAMIANRRRGQETKSAGFCPKCGSPVLKADRFCPKCGTVLH